jgi:hypothetical protein
VRLLIRIRGIPKKGQPGDVGHDLFEKLQPFGREPCAKLREFRDVSVRPAEAGDKASAQGIAGDGHDDGDRRGGPLGGESRRRTRGHDDLDVEPHQLRRKARPALIPSAGRSIFEDDVLALYVA